MKKCSKCKAKLDKNDLVCPECGADITAQKKKHTKGLLITLITVFALIMVFGLFGGLSTPVKGYYEFESKPYYFQNGVWYTYSEYGDGGWYAFVPDPTYTDHCKDYYKGNKYDEASTFKKFEDSEYYVADGVVNNFTETEKKAE